MNILRYSSFEVGVNCEYRWRAKLRRLIALSKLPNFLLRLRSLRPSSIGYEMRATATCAAHFMTYCKFSLDALPRHAMS